MNSLLLQELSILSQFNAKTFQEGLKVHESAASAENIEATKRLFDKGLVTQSDGGYLTSLGKDAADHLQDLIVMLKA